MLAKRDKQKKEIRISEIKTATGEKDQLNCPCERHWKDYSYLINLALSLGNFLILPE